MRSRSLPVRPPSTSPVRFSRRRDFTSDVIAWSVAPRPVGGLGPDGRLATSYEKPQIKAFDVCFSYETCNMPLHRPKSRVLVINSSGGAGTTLMSNDDENESCLF